MFVSCGLRCCHFFLDLAVNYRGILEKAQAHPHVDSVDPLRKANAYPSESFVFVCIAFDGVLHMISFCLGLDTMTTYSHWLRKRSHEQRRDLQCERHGGRDGRAVTVLRGAIEV